jgi:hypothetical protein
MTITIVRSSLIAAKKPISGDNEFFRLLGGLKRTDKAAAVPIFKRRSFYPILLIEIGLAVAELANVSGAFSIFAKDAECDAKIQSLYALRQIPGLM